jgi:DNA primase
MTNDIEEVKRRADIVDLVGSYVALKKAGKDYKALCPFHKEKTPSMFVSPEKQIFKCFGCGKGGDVFDFVTEIEGLEFGDALKLLADRTGVELTPRTRVDREAPGLKSRLFAINRLSALFYHKILLEHPSAEAARNYLRGRGVIATSIKNFMIGYAPSQGPLTTFLTRKGFTSFEIEQAGRPDRFSRRITFPLFDVVGNVVGFSGRVWLKRQSRMPTSQL